MVNASEHKIKMEEKHGHIENQIINLCFYRKA